MARAKTHVSNFAHLAVHDERLARLGALAEHYFPQGPNTCLLKLRQFGELMAQDIAARFDEYSSTLAVSDFRTITPLVQVLRMGGSGGVALFRLTTSAGIGH